MSTDEDGLSTEELRALIEVEGADVVAGTVDEVHARMHRLIDEPKRVLIRRVLHGARHLDQALREDLDDRAGPETGRAGRLAGVTGIG